MNICLLNNLYKPYNRGGAENVVEIYHKELSKRGHQVHVITTEPYGESTEKEDIFYIKSLFSSLVSLPLFLRFFWHIWDFFNFVSAYRIYKILKKKEINLLITHNIKGLGFLFLLFLRSLNIRHFHVLHDIQLLHPSGLLLKGEEKKIDSVFARFYQYLSLKFFSYVEVVISPSKWLLDMHKNKGFFAEKRTFVRKNPFLFPKSSDNHVEDDKFRFLYVGQFVKHKGVFFLLDVFCHDNFDGSVLKVVGDVNKNKIKKFENKNIQFTGKLDRDSVFREMQQSDCLIVPSLCYENSPTVIYEANSVGLPILASEIGGIGELVDECGGILFEAGDRKRLIEKIKWCIDNKRKMKKMTKENIFKNNTKIYFDFIESL